MQDKYMSVWNTMEDDKWYTAKELGMAAASMTAMVRRGLVVDRAGKPKQYKKTVSTLINKGVLALWQKKIQCNCTACLSITPMLNVMKMDCF